LTLPPEDHRSNDIPGLYKTIYERWRTLKDRINYEWGKTQFITLIEQHRSGVPHVNVLIRNSALAQASEGDGWKGLRGENGKFFKHVVESNFGKRLWLEPIRDKEAIAGYFVKLMGEVTKGSQVPVMAPKHFRRIRASRGLLPPTFKQVGTNFEGKLYRCPCESSIENQIKKMAEIADMVGVGYGG
jgi:hypothetical protein